MESKHPIAESIMANWLKERPKGSNKLWRHSFFTERQQDNRREKQMNK